MDDSEEQQYLIDELGPVHGKCVHDNIAGFLRTRLIRRMKELNHKDPWISVDGPDSPEVDSVVQGAWFDDIGNVEFETCRINREGYWLRATGYVDAPDFWQPIVPPDAL